MSIPGLPSTRETDIPERVQKRATKMTEGLTSLTQGEAERAASVQTGKEKAQGNLINVYK